VSIDVFDDVRFEGALTIALEKSGLSWRQAGYQRGELHFHILVKELSSNLSVGIEVNSSIRTDGISAGTGEDSIRAWIADQDGFPLGNKVQKWVTRVPGWEQRLLDMLSKLITMAQSINICPDCNEVEKVWIVKKDGANKGRIFKNCENGCAFIWLDEVEEDAPDCPNCQRPMVKRTGHKGDFWGCRGYPNCRGTRNIDGDEPHWKKLEREHETAKETNENGSNSVKQSLKDKIHSILPGTAKNQQVISKDKDFTPSPFQQAIFDWVSSPGKNLIVEAVAGSGKTTTGVKMLELVPANQRVLFVAFNKHIAKELAKRAPSHVRVTTYHSLGFKAVRQAYGKVDLDTRKVRRLLEVYFDRTQYSLISPVRQIVSLVKANLVEDLSYEGLSQLVNYYDIALNSDERTVYQAVEYVMAKCTANTNTIDFDDMCYFPIYHNLPMEKYDFIFIDEAQDTNKNQIELALKCAHDDTRIVACGDRYQSLYGFRGADVQAIPNLIESLSADTLPLSITYRNPKCVVSLVNERFPHIPLHAADWAEEGQLQTLPYSLALDRMASSDMVLCRNNAPLVRPAFALIRNGIKAVIRGRDIGKGLISLIRKMEADDVFDLSEKLVEYEDLEVTKLLLAKRSYAAQTIQDKVETILAIGNGCQYIHEVEDKIEEVFSDEVEGVVFSTVHKAKGLEADNVYILNPELMPSSYASETWELQQEENIEYVAYTRAMKTLTIVV